MGQVSTGVDGRGWADYHYLLEDVLKGSVTQVVMTQILALNRFPELR